MPPQVTCAYAVPGKGGNTKISFFTQIAVLAHCLNSTSCLISSIYLTHESRLIRCCMIPSIL